MNKSQKWAEQCLAENTFRHTDENGNEVTETIRTLEVCRSGKELYRKAFLEGKYKGKNLLAYPFDFIVLHGDLPAGRFYDVEYTIGEHGTVYHALIQAVDPVTDLQLIIGTLKTKNWFPANFKSRRAWLREDIDCVFIGSCSKDEKGPVFSGSTNRAGDGIMADGKRWSYLDAVVAYGEQPFDYYRNDLREVWIPQECDCSKEKVFVCGVNGDDPDFAQQRAEALAEMFEHLEEATQIADDYGISFFYAWQQESKNLLINSNGITLEGLETIVKSMKDYYDKNEK